MDTMIFTTGAFVQAYEIEINGRKQWHWIVTEFEDDSYQNGKNIDVCEYADTLENLFLENVTDI